LGTTKNQRKAAAREQARRAVEVFGLPREIDAEIALLGELYRTQGHVDSLERYVQGMSLDELHGADGAYWVRLLADERKHLARVATECMNARVDERLLRLSELQAGLLAKAMQGLLTAAGLNEHPQAREWVREQLQLVAPQADARVDAP
jgi:hypothetical protein